MLPGIPLRGAISSGCLDGSRVSAFLPGALACLGTESQVSLNQPGVVPADLRQQVPNNSYDVPPSHWVDIKFQCCDCKSVETWTAKRQTWLYEVAEGSLYASAVRCRACRDKIRAAKELPRERLLAAR